MKTIYITVALALLGALALPAAARAQISIGTGMGQVITDELVSFETQLAFEMRFQLPSERWELKPVLCIGAKSKPIGSILVDKRIETSSSASLALPIGYKFLNHKRVSIDFSVGPYISRSSLTYNRRKLYGQDVLKLLEVIERNDIGIQFNPTITLYTKKRASITIQPIVVQSGGKEYTSMTSRVLLHL